MADVPYDQRDGFIWMDGKMVPWKDAKVHYLTHGLHYGTSVFEGERMYNGKIFKSRLHSERLIQSGKMVNIHCPYSVDELEEAKYEVVKANNLTNAYVRAALWCGAERMGIDISGSKPHVGVAAWDWGKYFPESVTLSLSEYHKPAPKSAPIHSKCASLYVLSTMVKKEAQDKGFNDALMLDYEGYVAESSGANIFMVSDGELHTPIADRFLNGITRQTVIELAKDRDIKVVERRIKLEEMPDFQEIFLTGSAAELTPVSQIDDTHYQIGQVTKTLQKAYSDLVEGKA